VQVLNGTPCYVAEAGYCEVLAFDLFAVSSEEVFYIVNCAVAGCFGTDSGTAVGEALTGENAGEFVAESLVLTEEIADFTCANADVACRNVRIVTDVLCEYGHEALAEAHDFVVGLACGIEVGTALTAAHRETGERVLEGLFEAEELHDGSVYGRVETETSLVRTDCGVELYTVTAVNLYVACVVYPAYTEGDHTFRFNHTFENAGLYVVGALFNNGFEGFEYFFDGLKEFRFTGISLACIFINTNEIRIL
jgi:hypothetical protein